MAAKKTPTPNRPRIARLQNDKLVARLLEVNARLSSLLDGTEKATPQDELLSVKAHLDVVSYKAEKAEYESGHWKAMYEEMVLTKESLLRKLAKDGSPEDQRLAKALTVAEEALKTWQSFYDLETAKTEAYKKEFLEALRLMRLRDLGSGMPADCTEGGSSWNKFMFKHKDL